MYENIVIESCANVIDCEEVRRVCAGAAHQIRMIKRALQEAAACLLHVPVFLFRCAPFVLFPSVPLFLPVFTFSTCTGPDPCAHTGDET